MEFLEIPIYDDDLIKLVVRFTINLLVLMIALTASHFSYSKRSSSHSFMLCMMNIMTFFICFSLKKLDLDTGMALGLFAIFAIIRYRTDTIRVNEMTYLFVVIGIAVINSLANKQTSYAELAFTNGAVVVGLFLFQQFSRPQPKLAKQEIVWDKLDLILPDAREALLKEILKRTGLVAQRVKFSKIDFQKGVASATIYYEGQDLDYTDGDEKENMD